MLNKNTEIIDLLVIFIREFPITSTIILLGLIINLIIIIFLIKIQE